MKKQEAIKIIFHVWKYDNRIIIEPKQGSRVVSYFFNNKKIKFEKLLKIFMNNISENSEIEVHQKRRFLPFYKGDYLYFQNNYGVKGFSRLDNQRIYVSCKNVPCDAERL